jgi:hypothetical protein
MYCWKLAAVAAFIVSLSSTLKYSGMQYESMQEKKVYSVAKLTGNLNIDANWNKPEWSGVKSIRISNRMGEKPPFEPLVEAKVMYNDSNVFVIFRVQDRFVKSTVTEINGPVSENSCVEFFFAPDADKPLHYFNLEINAGGTPLLFYVTKPWSGYTELSKDDIRQIEIAHSLPSTVDPEIPEPTTWTIECRVPISMLQKYATITQPASGVKWKANFYKTGSATSNPNYLTWSKVEFPKPNFHLPEFFGTIVFE